jgi:hypothetical protein
LRGDDGGLVMTGSAAHGRGMAQALRLIGVDATGTVIATTVLFPGRFRTIDGASYLVELPLHAGGPQPGDRLLIEPIVPR